MELGARRIALRGLRDLRSITGGKFAIYLPALVTVAIILLLLGMIAVIAFQHRVGSGGVETAWTFDNFKDVYTDSFVYETILNTVGFSLVTVIVAMSFGMPIAWLSERTDLPGRKFVFPVMTLTVVIPSFFTAMGWQFLFGNRIGIVNKWIQQLTPIDVSPFNINTVVGMGWVEGVTLSALAYIMIAGIFRAMDPTLEESAQVHGVGFLAKLRYVTLPLAWPGILAASLYVFAIGFAAFDIPAIIGLSGHIFTFSTFIYTEVNDPNGQMPNYGLIGAASVMLLAAALAMSWWYLKVISRSSRYAVVTGRSYHPRLTELGRKWVLGWGFIALTFMLALGLPLLSLMWASVTPYLQMPSVAAFNGVSFENFRDIPWRGFRRAIRNTIILAIAVPTLTAVAGLAISWIVVKNRGRFSAPIDIIAFLPHVVPGLIFGLGALLLTLFWAPRSLGLYGSLNIILIVYVVTRVSFPTRIYNGSLLQIHRELEEVGYVFGLRQFRVLWHVLIPLLRPVLVYTWLWMSLLTVKELAVAAFLASPRNVTAPAFIWSIWASGEFNISAALSLLFVLAIVPVVVIYFIATRRIINTGA
jgi:iron(III) transport system permease protein